MIKGCQKKIVHITNTGSPYFEEAYFILKQGGIKGSAGDKDIVKEALRITESTAVAAKPKPRRRRNGGVMSVLLGAAVCSFVFGVVMLIFMLAT